jgi:hypothetical protein
MSYKEINICILNNRILSYVQKRQFCKDLEREDKLMGFLAEIQVMTSVIIYE